MTGAAAVASRGEAKRMALTAASAPIAAAAMTQAVRGRSRTTITVGSALATATGATELALCEGAGTGRSSVLVRAKSGAVSERTSPSRRKLLRPGGTGSVSAASSAPACA